MHCFDLTVEGLPGAGKTTALRALERAGHTVLGEYTTTGGALLAPADHPHHRDEAAHLTNWLRKAAQVRGCTGPVWVDRNWLTALAYAASTGGLAERAAWAYRHLAAGTLLPPRCWIVLDVPPTVSLARRRARLEPAHPWWNVGVLHRLRDFYRDPPAALTHAHQDLAALVTAVPRLRIDADRDPEQLARAIEAAGTR
ncbi:AAA family ATPase [Streptomyces sp. PTM05]|uniref:AAA family ATPase n=1 Tax=Streptantibioticus parmotrematis TaxID=2873249 RepID=A0ABS7R160_9ACTN|nr:AAA family ATPase [Streptantibioticus parmotrematis]MBY8889209.1 AAA family ATPase [Streptantibioticus parmotrematis]